MAMNKRKSQTVIPEAEQLLVELSWQTILVGLDHFSNRVKVLLQLKSALHAKNRAEGHLSTSEDGLCLCDVKSHTHMYQTAVFNDVISLLANTVCALKHTWTWSSVSGCAPSMPPWKLSSLYSMLGLVRRQTEGPRPLTLDQSQFELPEMHIHWDCWENLWKHSVKWKRPFREKMKCKLLASVELRCCWNITAAIYFQCGWCEYKSIHKQWH